MSDEGARKRWEERAYSPYEPMFTTSGQGTDVDAQLRMAHALEYIAAQVGQINTKLDKLVRD